MLCSVSSRTLCVVSLEVVDCVSLLGGISLRCFAACQIVRSALFPLRWLTVSASWEVSLGDALQRV